jgi:hypothetical protein
MPAKASQGLHLRHQPEARGDLPVTFRPEPSSPDTTSRTRVSYSGRGLFVDAPSDAAW